MKFRHCMLSAGMLFALLAAAAAGASAQTSCGNNDFNLTSDASAQGLLVAGNSGYRGYVTSGNLAPGTWSLTINDTGWPTSTNSRRNYVRSNYYTYDSVNHVFRATFPTTMVAFQLISTNMQFNGVAQVTMEAPDTVPYDGVMSNTEFNGAQTFIASTDTPCGTSTPVCGGPGSGQGNAMGSGGVSSPIIGAMTTQPCAVAVENQVWGGVKVRFRD